MDILSLLSQSISDMAIIRENVIASNVMETDIIAALEQRTASEAERVEACHV